MSALKFIEGEPDVPEEAMRRGGALKRALAEIRSRPGVWADLSARYAKSHEGSIKSKACQLRKLGFEVRAAKHEGRSYFFVRLPAPVEVSP